VTTSPPFLLPTGSCWKRPRYRRCPSLIHPIFVTHWQLLETTPVPALPLPIQQLSNIQQLSKCPQTHPHHASNTPPMRPPTRPQAHPKRAPNAPSNVSSRTPQTRPQRVLNRAPNTSSNASSPQRAVKHTSNAPQMRPQTRPTRALKHTPTSPKRSAPPTCPQTSPTPTHKIEDMYLVFSVSFVSELNELR